MSGLSQSKLICRILQWISSAALLLLAVILIAFLIKETVVLAGLLFTANDSISIYLLVDGLIVYFLYFEFIALIIKYFQSNYHFPLQYFIYIAITAVIRLIVVEHKDPQLFIIYSVSILVLIFALYVSNADRLKPKE
ncbi:MULTISPECIES: phosphate-starvation-inducible protein PsiE [Providencia]|jgi:protein PsiE|uniref:phosphate-starvation-inducible protein PsiE n=1 Tax=Providencia TaxID=586 RepID=UPI0012B5FA22|nr:MULTISPECIES: phosphate-starvation-inducible protein PsiE [Providencia]MBC5790754.1 phosphate-starvation-inducible protein PsiE [Providencia sp. JUb39]MBS0932827.1 phosphate-starvation-inducible protein PsiE [Providencia sp. JGM172]MBS0997020.1 phosphate-starvation-inducible protein PsiE [Providencia sp. JGM178]MTC21347.1 phosphate-starvation-inducible protein PsiE [Providencia sp. wls1938]MTC40988.1 phosphate-starvation-inducible protein PsiE [Providencia sp. wls1921]